MVVCGNVSVDTLEDLLLKNTKKAINLYQEVCMKSNNATSIDSLTQ